MSHQARTKPIGDHCHSRFVNDVDSTRRTRSTAVPQGAREMSEWETLPVSWYLIRGEGSHASLQSRNRSVAITRIRLDSRDGHSPPNRPSHGCGSTCSYIADCHCAVERGRVPDCHVRLGCRFVRKEKRKRRLFQQSDRSPMGGVPGTNRTGLGPFRFIFFLPDRPLVTADARITVIP